jgi:DNA adenine methylase
VPPVNGCHLHSPDASRLAKALLVAPYPWVLTYDDDKLIWNELYGRERCARFDIAHTAQVSHVGRETVVYGPSLEVPVGIEITPGVQASWVV